MATKQDIRNEGFRRGQSIASQVNVPIVGSDIHPSWIGDTIITEANRYAAWQALATERATAIMWAHGLGDIAETKPYDVWEVFEAGITAGIQAYGRKHHACALANATGE